MRWTVHAMGFAGLESSVLQADTVDNYFSHGMQAPLLEIHELQDRGEIGITFSYNEEVKESLKQTFGSGQGRTWDPDSKMWKLPAELFEEVKAWALGHFDETMIRLPGQVTLPLSPLSASDSQQS